MLNNWLNALRELVRSFGAFLISYGLGSSKAKEKANESALAESIKARELSERNTSRSNSDARERLRKITGK